MPSLGALDSTETFVGAGATVYIAAALTAKPADAIVDPGTGWYKVGHTANDGISLTFAKNVIKLYSHQAFNAIRNIIDTEDFTVGLSLLQLNAMTMAFALKATVSGSTPDYTITPLTPGQIDTRAMILDFTDGADTVRWWISSGIVGGDVQMQFSKSAFAALPITFEVNGSDGATAWQAMFHGASFSAT